LASVTGGSPVVAVDLLGTQTGVVAREDGTLSIVNLIDPFFPKVSATWETSHVPNNLDVISGLIAVSLGAGGVALLQVHSTY
jgi:hypothetical protein